MFETRNTRFSSKNEVYNSSARSRSKERVGDGGQGRSNNIQGISTSSLFDVPKGIPSLQSVAEDDVVAPKNTPIINTTSRSSSSSPTRTTSPSDYRQQRFPQRSSSRILGGAELAKRMQQRESEVSQGGGLDDVKHSTSDGTERFMVDATERKASCTNRGMRQLHKTMKDKEELMDDANYIVHSISGDCEVPTILVKTGNDEEKRSLDDHWVKVEDPSTKRSFYWNTETGEMKRSE
jgi:hypothetical protein